jgi:hypothetical protein
MPGTTFKRAALLLLLPLAACAASPEQRVQAALVDAGVKEEVARCMAERMAAKLSISQLLELKRLGSLARQEEPGKKMTPRRILRKVEALGDPEVVSVTSHAAIVCYVVG